MSTQTESLREDQVLDTRGLLCPMPVIKASQTVKSMSAGQVLKVLASDPGSKADFPAWAESTGHRLLGHKAQDGVFVYWIQKA